MTKIKENSASNQLSIMLRIIKEFGYQFTPKSTIMDFGCGSGRTVSELRSLGYQAFGCDVAFKTDKDVDTASLSESSFIRPISFQPYSLPFEDNTFDFILSNQVFEHVKNYSEAISEIRRVLKPNGICLHVFPSRYKPIEAHVSVPFSSMIQTYAWLYIWAKLGLRNKSQHSLSAQETASKNFNYLRQNTNYLSKKQISKEFKNHFDEIMFCESTFFKISHKARHFHSLSKIFPFIPSLYSTFHSRVVLIR